MQRYRRLAAKQEISKSDFDQYDSTAKQHVASLQAIKAAFLAAERVGDLRKAQLEQAQLNLEYTRIVAPVAGVVMKALPKSEHACRLVSS